MRTTHLRYVISDERLRAYARVPLLDRLRWLEELATFTRMWRDAPVIDPPAKAASDRESGSAT